MRQGYYIEIVAEFAHVRHVTDQCCQNGQLIQELANREFADRDHETWFQDRDLSSKPGHCRARLLPWRERDRPPESSCLESNGKPLPYKPFGEIPSR